MDAAASLTGHAVLVTRPAHQAGPLARLIRERGGEPVLFPTLEIQDAPDPRPLREALARIASYGLLVFVSANAAAKAVPAIEAAGGMAAGARVAAVGEGTAAELRRLGVREVVTPEAGADSEALLHSAALRDVQGLRVAIFSGVGGRDLLAATLRERGADVCVVPCYQRARPETSGAPIRDRLAAGTLAAVTVTSAEGVRNLYAMVDDGAAMLGRLPHVASHERVARAARECGAIRVVVSGSGDLAMVDALAGVLAPATVAASDSP